MDIYYADIRDYAHRLEELLPLLPLERQRRLEKTPTEEKKLQNLCAGLLLRHVIGDKPLITGAYGKPYLPGGPQFSLSHGGNMAVLAVSDCPVGVDVERPRPVKDAVIRRYFQPEEQRWLREAGENGFFRLWTRKEAVLKCCGRGLSLSPATFSVLPGEMPMVEELRCHLHTWELAGHLLSAATTGATDEPRLIPFSIPEN